MKKEWFKQRRNQKLAQRKDKKTKKIFYEKGEKEIEGIKNGVRKSKEERRLNENKKVNELEDNEKKPKKKERETDAEQNEKNEDTDCLGKIPMGAEDSEMQDKMCYSRYEENLVDNDNNRKLMI